MSKYLSRTIFPSVSVPVLSVHKIFIAPKFSIESNFFAMVFFFDILTAPLDKLEDSITGRSRGVIVIAIATANVKAVIFPCLNILSAKTIGIIINMNFINNLLIFSISL